MSAKSIAINIWDDYHDDGFVPAGDIQQTYAYIESNLTDDDCKRVLALLKENIELLAKPEWLLELALYYYDSAKTHPNLVGTEHERHLYKRWQLEIKHLTHEAREWLVDALATSKLMHLGTPISIYSES